MSAEHLTMDSAGGSLNFQGAIGTTLVKFGHDGWYGLLADEVGFAEVGSLARMAGTLMTRDAQSSRRLLIGYDRRFLSDAIAYRVANDLIEIGVECVLLERPLATACVAFAVAHSKCAGGMMITGANLPAPYSGLKLFAKDGGSLPRWFLDQIEDAYASGAFVDPVWSPVEMTRLDPVESYLNSFRKFIPVASVRASGITVAVDAMWGTASGLVPSLLHGDGSRCVEIHTTHNPLFPDMIAPRPIFTDPHRLRTVVTTGDAAFGVAISADAGELSVIDEHGGSVSPGMVAALLSHYMLSMKGTAGTVARSITASTSMDEIARQRGVLTHELAIGHPAVSDAVRELDPMLVADGSGGYIFGRHVLERDAIMATLLIAAAIVESGASLSDLIADVEQICGNRYLVRKSVALAVDEIESAQVRLTTIDWPNVIDDTVVQSRYATDGVRLELEDDEWLLVRYDEFEQSLQIVAESKSEEKAERLVDVGHALVFS